MCYYRLNEFLVDSPFALPAPSCRRTSKDEAAPLSFTLDRCSLHTFSQVQWAGRRHGGTFLRAYYVGDRLLICAGELLKMAISRAGDSITFDFDPEDPMATAFARALAVNLGLAVCTLLRGDLAIHGAAVELDHQLIGILGPSGAGKSTLLWALLSAGARFANDDVIPVRKTKHGITAIPAMSLPAKLTMSALQGMGKDWTSDNVIFPGEEDVWIPIDPDLRVMTSYPLSALFIIRPVADDPCVDKITFDRITGGASLSLLMQQTQGLWAAQSMLEPCLLLEQYRALMHGVPIYMVGYPKRMDVLPRLVDAIRSTVQSLPRLDDRITASNGNQLHVPFLRRLMGLKEAK